MVQARLGLVLRLVPRSRASKRGSVHTNIWEGPAIDLAERNVIAIHGVTGWWKDQKRKKRTAPYSLIVSIESEDASEDIWTPVANEVGVTIEAASLDVVA